MEEKDIAEGKRITMPSREDLEAIFEQVLIETWGLDHWLTQGKTYAEQWLRHAGKQAKVSYLYVVGDSNTTVVAFEGYPRLWPMALLLAEQKVGDINTITGKRRTR